ncbi:MAG: N-acetylmuramoyl-L-alanine amidase [Desulfopila sp.]
MLRYLSLFFVLCLTFAGSLYSGGALCSNAAENTPFSIQDHYNQAKFFYKQLQTKDELAKQRSLWLKGGRKFRRVYLADPKSEMAPASLFMLGQLYEKMFTRFNKRPDLNEAISYYRDCQSLFPRHQLADDALYALGNIHLKNLSLYNKAAGFYATIVNDYPQGDMYPRATNALKSLSSDFDIALPKAMVNGSTHKKLTNVLPVKYWSSVDYSRIIINASGPVTYSASLLHKNPSKPRRLYIDFQNSYIKPRYRSPIPIADGLLKRIRTAQHSSDTVRVAVDIESVSDYKIFSLPDPFRVVIDIRGKKRRHAATKIIHRENFPKKFDINEQQVSILSRQKKVLPLPPRQSHAGKVDVDVQKDFSLAQQLGLGVRRIVIDPGHGGKDPGAISHGLKEKDIVLDLSRKLKERLEQIDNYEVILTRDQDRYISLEERTAIANGNNADLFVSIHINAHRNTSVRGIETYFLNLASNKEAMRVAAFENATSELQMSDLQDVLAGIMKNSKRKESSRLADSVHSSLIRGLADSGFAFKDLGVKQAPFYVLIGAEMPAILLEVAFISNPEEARTLQDDHFHTSFAEQASRGVTRYIHANISQLSSN